MVEFLTLFLGLASGPQTVELDVVGAVAAVEVGLDGETLATLTAPPWVLEIDLGPLLPHDLVAIARDAAGRELDRAQQWINVSLSRSGAKMAFSDDDQGRPEAVRVVWESIGQTELEDVELEFDGQPLAVDDPERIPLPAHEADEFHYVSGAVRFPDEATDRLESDYGGARSAEISSELTAVAVVLERGRGLPPPAQMRSWFVKDGRPLAVHGVDKGAADLIVVRGSGSQRNLDLLATVLYASTAATGSTPARLLEEWDPARYFGGEGGVARRAGRSPGLIQLSRFGSLGADVRLSWVSTRPGSLSPRGIEPGIFIHSRDYAAAEGGLIELVQRARSPGSAPKLAQAVALAGILAHSGNHRRAVLVILGDDAEDASDHSAAIARDYLRALRVPLVVWAFDSASVHDDWRELIDLGDPSEPGKVLRRLDVAVGELRRLLKRQRVVWLEGRHLPQRIELGPAARGIRLAGAS